MTIGQRIAYHRKLLNLSQEALGERLNVSRQAVYKWESDLSLPDSNNLIELSRLFEIGLGELIGEKSASTETIVVEPVERTKSSLWVIGILSVVVLVLLFQVAHVSGLNSQLRHLQVNFDSISKKLDEIDKRIPIVIEDTEFNTLEFGLPKLNFQESTMDLSVDLSLKMFTTDTEVSLEIQGETYRLNQVSTNRFSTLVTIPLATTFNGNILIARNQEILSIPFDNYGSVFEKYFVRISVADADLKGEDIIGELHHYFPLCTESPCQVSSDASEPHKVVFEGKYSISDIEWIIRDSDGSDVTGGRMELISISDMQNEMTKAVIFKGAKGLLGKEGSYSVYYTAIYDDMYRVEVLDGVIELTSGSVEFIPKEPQIILHRLQD